MKTYDVVIVGAGPAGLYCTENLTTSGLSVLLLEKNNTFGKKVCAGGITKKDIDLLAMKSSFVKKKINGALAG